MLSALALMTVCSLMTPSSVGAGMQPVAWLRQPGAPADKAVHPSSLAPDIQQALGASAWPGPLGDLTEAGAPEWLYDGCLDVSAKNADICVYGPPAGTHVMAVLGDSVAVSWLQGLRRVAGREGWRIHVFTRRQCPNAEIPAGLTTAVSSSCADQQQWALDQVHQLRPELIVLSNQYGAATPEQWRAGLTQTLAKLSDLPSRIVVLSPPGDSQNLQTCQSAAEPSQCSLPLSARYLALSAAERAAATSYGARFVDTRTWFCVNGRCPALIQGIPVEFDGIHLTAAYSRFLAPYIQQALQRSGA